MWQGFAQGGDPRRFSRQSEAVPQEVPAPDPRGFGVFPGREELSVRYVRRLLGDIQAHKLLDVPLGEVLQAAAISSRPESPSVFRAVCRGGDFVVRIPREERTCARLEREAALLRDLRPIVSLQLPEIRFLPAGPLHPAFAVHRAIPGRTLDYDRYLEFSGAEQERLAAEVANFCTQLHGVSLAAAADWLGIPLPGRQDLDSFAARRGGPAWFSSARRDQVRAALTPYLSTGLREVFERTVREFEGLEVSGRCLALAHGDLWGSNMAILADHRGRRLIGVFDFLDASILDFHEDLFRLGLIDERLMRDIVERYGRSSRRAPALEPPRLDLYYRAFMFSLMNEWVERGDSLRYEIFERMLGRHTADFGIRG